MRRETVNSKEPLTVPGMKSVKKREDETHKQVESEMRGLMKKILIVEDDHTQNDVLANFLRKESYDVVSVYTIMEARRVLSREWHLIILDIILPDGNGLEFLKEIRQRSNVPVIVLTALDDEFTQIQTFDLKADEYIDKPVSPIVMTRRVNALMKRFYEHSGNTSVTIGSFSFDFDVFAVYNDREEELKLTVKEMKIVQMLYENQGNVVTRDDIMNHVWGPEYYGEDRLIDTHIKNIRKKLDSDIIITVKGVGYRLNTKERD